jgi:hypothetical protein
VDGGDDLLLARMGRGGEPERPPGEGAAEAHPLGLVVGQRRRALLERARDGDPGRAERLELLGGELVLGEDAVETRQQRLGHAAEQAPAAEAPLGDPRVDQQHRNAAAVRRPEGRRPELALGPDRDVGAPVVEEALDPGQHVHGGVLVQAALGHALGEVLRRGDGAGGHEAGEVGAVPVSRRRNSSSEAPRRRSRRGTRRAGPRGGRGPGAPMRSPRRSGSSLPAARRRSSTRRATPAPRRDSAR